MTAAQAQVPDVDSDGDEGKGASRGEKKARKALSKLGLKHLKDIARVTLKRPKNVIFAIASPDVYKSATSDTYVVFGEAKVEDMNAAQQQMMHAASTMPTVTEEKLMEGVTASSSSAKPSAAAEEDGETVDESGVEPKDIELVMTQAGVSRAKAVKALKAADNDIVNAIMDLTM
jgi:nascent polypeptide-associated complex subunit alpha